MSPFTVENCLLIKALWSNIHSRGPNTEHRFSFSGKSALARTLFIQRICLKDFAVNFVFKYVTCQLQNKEYLITIFRQWPLSCKQFLSEHFAENCMSLWRTVAKLWCINFVHFFSGTPCMCRVSASRVTLYIIMMDSSFIPINEDKQNSETTAGK